jgi:hypothetical protein
MAYDADLVQALVALSAQRAAGHAGAPIDRTAAAELEAFKVLVKVAIFEAGVARAAQPLITSHRGSPGRVVNRVSSIRASPVDRSRRL